MSQTHIAGPPITLNHRWVRQRCSWCGALIVNFDLEMVGSPDGRAPSTWEQGVHVRVEPGVSSTLAELEPCTCGENPGDVAVPADSCMALDPAVTA